MKTIYETSFEDPFEYYGGISELEVPKGWVPLWVEGTKPGVNVRPEFKPEKTIVRLGVQAAKITTRYASHDAVLCYDVQGAEPGKVVTFEAWAANWKDKCGHGMRIGIDPTGKIGYPNNGIVWSEWWGQYDNNWVAATYRRFFAQATAESTSIAIYLHSRSDYAANNVASYWEDVLVQIPSDTPPPATECKALTYDETVQAVKQGVLEALKEICGGL